jgi:dihydroorotase
VALLELFHRGEFTLEAIVQKTAHNVAECFKIAERGYIREGYKADLVLVDLHNAWKVSSDNILYKCAWSPLDKQEFQSKIISTFVNGVLVYTCGEVIERSAAERISFNR